MGPSPSDVDGGPAPGAAPRADACDPGAPPRLAPLPLPSFLGLRFQGVPVLTLLLLTFALCVLVGNYLPTRTDAAATERALTEQRRENGALAERIRRAEADAARLETDPWTHERILRNELQMTRPGEVIVR